jgi:DNA (cytosine-5)-methyltransferase 3A
LFYEYVRLLKECNPKYFLLENVKMKKEWQDIISSELGCEPIKINSNLVSAQNRERLYWTNIPISELQDKGVFIEDILDKSFDEKYWLKEKNTELLLKKVNIENAPNVACIDVYNKKLKLDRKCPTLTLPHHNSIRLLQNGRIRKLTPNECEKLQTVPINYTDCELSDIHRYSMLGNGWTVDVIAHIFGGLSLHYA